MSGTGSTYPAGPAEARSPSYSKPKRLHLLPTGLRLAALAFAALACLADPLPAQAAAAPGAATISGCWCGQDPSRLVERFQSISQTAVLEDARELALSDSRAAQSALRRARWLVPGSESLAASEVRLVDYDTRVGRANSSAAVAAEYASLVGLPKGVPANKMQDIEFKAADCNYTDRELIAIVLGLILGVIPGLILLILLC